VNGPELGITLESALTTSSQLSSMTMFGPNDSTASMYPALLSVSTTVLLRSQILHFTSKSPLTIAICTGLAPLSDLTPTVNQA